MVNLMRFKVCVGVRGDGGTGGRWREGGYLALQKIVTDETAELLNFR